MLTRFPPGPTVVESGLGGYAGVGANGKGGIVGLPPDIGPGEFAPYELPMINSHAYGPTGQRNQDCQPGQQGYPLGQIRVPGQALSDPADRVSDLPGSRGPTTLFYDQDGNRIQADTRVGSRQPETWKRVGR